MAKRNNKIDHKTDVDEDREDQNVNEGLDRDADLTEIQSVEEDLRDIYSAVEKGFQDQWTRANACIDYWEAYNCKLGQNQFYSGNSKIFVPIIHNAVNARKTRFTNQIFPQAGRYVECTSEDGTQPDALMSLLEHYVRKARLRTLLMPPLCVNGDVEGHYNVYVGWSKKKRHIAYRVKKPVTLDEEILSEDAGEIEDIREETITHGKPYVEVLADSDVLVLPHTSDSIEQALNDGGSVTILRRWGKNKIKQAIADGLIRKEAGEDLLKEMSKEQKTQYTDKSKEMVDAAGIKTGMRGDKYALIYETWHELALEDEDTDEVQRRLCRSFFGGPDSLLGSKRNPYWSDKCPLLSVPVDKIQGSFKGISKVKPCCDIQYQANDAVNEGMDSAAYALLPIVLTDPAKSPRVGSMVLSMAAIWETSPKDTQFANMPALWKDALTIVAACKGEIAETLSVSPAAITQHQTTTKGKRSQAEVAQDQQIDILTTADAVTVLEEGILTPILQKFIELDHQYRNEEITVRQFGTMGLRAKMQKIEPIQFERKYTFRWFGVEAARSQQQIQMQISGMNVLSGIPPDKYQGYRMNFIPIITSLVENTYGPRLAPLIFEDAAQQMPVPVQDENSLLLHGFEVPTHMMDNDDEHIQSHSQLMQMAIANENVQTSAVKQIQTHIWKHMQQKQAKVMAQMQAQQGGPGLPGAPPGGGEAGIQGRPRPGAVAMAPRGGQNPPGAIHQDTIGPVSGAPPRLRMRGT
jgi:hypothetical protein